MIADNGDKYVTHKDFIGYQDKLFAAINQHSQKVVDTVDARLSGIVKRLESVEKMQSECRADVNPVIERHKNINRLGWAVITAIALNAGLWVGIIGWLIKIGEKLRGL